MGLGLPLATFPCSKLVAPSASRPLGHYTGADCGRRGHLGPIEGLDGELGLHSALAGGPGCHVGLPPPPPSPRVRESWPLVPLFLRSKRQEQRQPLGGFWPYMMKTLVTPASCHWSGSSTCVHQGADALALLPSPHTVEADFVFGGWVQPGDGEFCHRVGHH